MCLNEDKKNFLDFANLPFNENPKNLSGLSLAFIGDAVYEVMVRRYILSEAEMRVQDLHKSAVKFVNASFQAGAADVLSEILTYEETAVFKRGRNAHTSHTPKNSSEAQYHKATGFEALFGYLYLKGEYDRLSELFNIIISLN